MPTLTPRPDQQEALDRLAAALSGHRRTQLNMPCGSGKTLVGAWHAQASGARIAVVLAPSLALVQQTAAAWLQVHPTARLLLVCSDATTAAGIAERQDAPQELDAQLDMGVMPAVTTRPDTVARHLDQTVAGRLTLIVGTYHSSPAIAAALQLADTRPSIDLLVLDEAHQLAGRVSDAFATALRDAVLPARQRLFMTATPVRLGNLADDDALDELERLDDRPLLSMDDTTVFGEVAYRLSAGEAIARGLLADYRVLVVAGDAGGSAEDDAVHALVDAIRRHHVRRVLTFHNLVAAARRFAARVSALLEVDGVPVVAEAVDGGMSNSAVRAALGRLGDPSASNRVTVVASARVLQEGVDVPAVDAVLFADPRTSNVDIVQAVGRALRLHPGKRHGCIVVPLPVRVDEDDDDQLAASRYGHVWRVLRGLRAHDDRVAAQLDEATRRWTASGTAKPTLPDWLEVTGVNHDDLPQVLVRIVRGSSAVWEQWYGLLQRETDRLGSAAPITTSTVVSGRKLGVWIGGQRWLHARQLLRADKVARLELIPGWSWSSTAAADARLLLTLQGLADQRGTAAENPSGVSAYEGLRDGQRRPLGRTLALLRHCYRNGELDPAFAASLTELPGWTWEPLSPTDRAGVDALRSFVTWEKHCDVPAEHVEGDVELGRWVLQTRRQQLLGTIPPALVDELLAAAPLGPKGATTWSWDHAGSQWLLNTAALQQYIACTGSATPMPVGHRESVDGTPVALYQWCSLQRHHRNNGRLPAERARWLQAQPGWRWQGLGVAKPAGDPIDLKGHAHGTAKGAAAKCPCQPCLDYTRAAGRHSVAQHKHRTDLVPPGPAIVALARVQHQLEQLTSGDRRFERQPGATAIATAANVPVGLIRDLTAGKTPRVTARESAALTALTAQQVLALYDTVGARGRLVMSCEQQVDAAPTVQLMKDLVDRGWTPRWIARELGYRQFNVKISGSTITQRMADQIAQLHARVGPRRAPVTHRNAHLARLEHLEAKGLVPPLGDDDPSAGRREVAA